ncbi:AraC family transcriptional regulator [Variovorax sp. PCZ-1]|uniref:AraC family transcriptional regulator n=1 Tax=Variovorax sp. PCZ-1 TaxID=2835533 RepID=UPI001BCAC060|nr:AraC family transcriptional regulator [Variovorax sp. PCZ-1]MBS7807318.1 AraC family transcriptional regulator [Variovorax sp. PCZ-1]
MDLSRMTELATRYLANYGSNNPGLNRLCAFREEAPSEIEVSVYEPALCLILQGSKMASIGDQSIKLSPGKALLISHDLPVVSRITKASASEPYLSFVLFLDVQLIRGLYEQVADLPPPNPDVRSLSVASAEASWLGSFLRYIELMDKPLDAKVLGPSILREIHYRLLLSSIGQNLRNLLVADSYASRIAKAIGQLRSEYRSPLRVSELAKIAAMSDSSFHKHFKDVTGTTPLQFQKDLRLIQAKVLLKEMGNAVSDAAFAVGYESPAHFSRDYSRRFGLAPSSDAARF